VVIPGKRSATRNPFPGLSSSAHNPDTGSAFITLSRPQRGLDSGLRRNDQLIITSASKYQKRHAGLDPASSQIHYGFRLSTE